MVSTALQVAEQVKLGDLWFPLFGQANVWIEDSVVDTRSSMLVQWCIQAALEETAPGQLQVIVFDEALTGIASPFEALNSGGERVLQTINDPSDLAALLHYLRQHIQGVNTSIRGQAHTLPDFRRLVDYPVESYKLVVIATDVSLLSDDLQNSLVGLMKSGPRVGVSFVVHSTSVGVNPYVVGLADKYAIKGDVVTTPISTTQLTQPLPSASELINTAEVVAGRIATTKLEPVEFAVMEKNVVEWGASSADGMTFAVGRHGSTTMEITIGDELNQRHNILVTGAVGQGKSNLLSVMIHSLCFRYSPSEVELYLLDFKEGVTLQRYADDGSGNRLPHARVLGLDADREFGLSVLHHLFSTYQQRMQLFKSEGVQSIKEFRSTHPDAELPRIVVVIDEFQVMFSERDRISDEFADLLVKGVRLFRAAGIHVVLASQTIKTGLALIGGGGDSLFAQVPIRIALKNSVAESQATLGSRNDAAAHLRAREAIVNLDYGDPSANRRTAIAFADEKGLAPMRERWSASQTSSAGTFVFAGEQKRSIVDDWAAISRTDRSAPGLLLGSTLRVDGQLLDLPLDRNTGRNACIVGPGEGATVLASLAVGLAPQLSRDLRVVILDLFDGTGPAAIVALANAVASHGATVEEVGSSDVAERIQRLEDEVGATAPGAPATTLVLGFGMDRIRDLPSQFADLVKYGPPIGFHFAGWWLKVDAFKRQVGYGGDAYFDVKVGIGLDKQSMRGFFGDPLLDWTPRDNRALAWDTATASEPATIIPYTIAPE